MQLRIKPSLWPRNFTGLLECAIAAGISGLLLLLLHHSFGSDRFQVLASRYDQRRMWRDAEPPLSQRVQDIELRLRRDLTGFESTRDGRRWNEVIWQSWRDQGLLKWRQSWIDQNPTWNYTLVLDEQADRLIQETFAEVPDVLDLWSALERPVLRADLFRYLITYAFGGMWADVDTTCTKPIDYWMSEELWNDPKVHDVVGIEYSDEGHGTNGWWRFLDFVQYVMLAKPLSPVMRETIVLVATRTHRLMEQQHKESIKDISWDFNTVIKTTGPASYTDACFKILEQETGYDEARITKQTYARMSAHRIGGIVVVPVKDWQAGGKGVPERYFIHHGQGSWL